MAEGGFSSEVSAVLRKGIIKTTPLLMAFIALTGCGEVDQAVIEKAEAVGQQDRYGEASFEGDAAEAYRKAYVDYLIQFDGKSETEAIEIAKGLYQENAPTSGWPASNTLWVTGEGVTAFDTSTALWNYVDDDNWETSFSEELRNAFGKDGKVLIAGSYGDMGGILTGLSGARVPAKSIRQQGGGVKIVEGPAAYTDMGVSE